MPTSKKPNLTYALDAEGNWRHVNEVDSGLSCNCICPHCRARLIAINSKPENESKAHHFAHERGSDCIWSDESSLHKLAKEVLGEEQKIMLPLLEGEAVSRQLEIDSVEQESRDSTTGLIPDCVCYYRGQKLWVEFKRTHEVDTKKAEKIRNAKIDCVEIDLNACEINKDAVRHFIVEEFTNRVWVYNSQTNQTKAWSEHRKNKEAEYLEHTYIEIERHLAFDEMARLINLHNIDSEYNVGSHQFYCLNCGKELKVYDNHFVHIEENLKCTDNIYLLNAAREVIYYNFNTSKKYNVSVPKYHFCKNKCICRFANEHRCVIEGRELYDLKSNGYSLCEKKCKFPGKEGFNDLIIRKPESLRNAIAINLSSEDCTKDLDSDIRQIDIHIENENDIFRLFEDLCNGRYLNFKESSDKKVKPEEVQSSVMKFSLYRSGKSFIGPVLCIQCLYPRNREVVKEYLFEGDIPDVETVRLYALLDCYEKKLNACYCEICAYLKRNPGYPPICIRYKRERTPRNPLDSKPCNCQSFGKNIELIAEIKERCKDLKLIDAATINSLNIST